LRDDVTLTLSEAAHERPYRLWIGLALSLAVHALMLFAWHIGAPAAKRDDAAMQRAIAVWLRPPPPPPVAEVIPPAPEPAPPKPRLRPNRSEAPSRPAPSTNVIAMPEPASGDKPPPDLFSVAPPSPVDAAPRFDREAAMRSARKMANDPDPAKAGTAVGQIPQKELATETRAARAISQAKRADCKDGLPGGLLGPLIILLDKKDSGCKW
jgi:hypothetical protein